MLKEKRLVKDTVCPNCYDHLLLRDIVTRRNGKVATCKCTKCNEIWNMLLFIMPLVGTSVDNSSDLSAVKADTDVLDVEILKRVL